MWLYVNTLNGGVSQGHVVIFSGLAVQNAGNPQIGIRETRRNCCTLQLIEAPGGRQPTRCLMDLAWADYLEHHLSVGSSRLMPCLTVLYPFRAAVPWAYAGFQAIATSSSKEAVRIKRQNHEELFERMECVVSGDDPEVVLPPVDPWSYEIAARTVHANTNWVAFCGVEQVLLALACTLAATVAPNARSIPLLMWVCRCCSSSLLSPVSASRTKFDTCSGP